MINLQGGKRKSYSIKTKWNLLHRQLFNIDIHSNYGKFCLPWWKTHYFLSILQTMDTSQCFKWGTWDFSKSALLFPSV